MVLKRTPLKRSQKPMRRTAMKRGGKKTALNDKARNIQKRAFEEAGIPYRCEDYRPHICFGDVGLNFSHSKKHSRGTTDDERIYLVALQCNHAHEKLTEGKSDQERVILQMILNRPTVAHPFFQRARQLAEEAMRLLDE